MTGRRGPPWRDRDFLLLWSGQTVSEVGSQITVLALPLVALLELDASTFEVGLLSAAVTVAYLLVALPAGALVERLSKRRVMVWADLGRLALIGSIPVAAGLGTLTLAQLYLVALANSVLSVLFSVAYPAYLPSLVDHPILLAGVLWSGSANFFVSGAGAVTAGALGSASGVRATLWLAVVGGCASGLWLFFSPLRGRRDMPRLAPAY
ncbi:MFS transporter [Asanoa iriomotensis]|uniref:MFS transporter n=1 Tax=Asanoa iriomotensis TaxID=234613 RepID=UPI001941F686|nr:MFS transporter [Asanoa iriomotensis]